MNSDFDLINELVLIDFIVYNYEIFMEKLKKIFKNQKFSSGPKIQNIFKIKSIQIYGVPQYFWIFFNMFLNLGSTMNNSSFQPIFALS